MKAINQLTTPNPWKLLIAPVLLFLSLSLPLHGQVLEAIIPIVECVEMIEDEGGGPALQDPKTGIEEEKSANTFFFYRVTFGYYNPNSIAIDLSEEGESGGYSELVYEYLYEGEPEYYYFEAPVTYFEPGRHYNAFFIDLYYTDETIAWEIFMPNKNYNSASANYEDVGFCTEPNPNIIPYYEPPADGKEENIIGAELTSLFNFFDPMNPSASELIFRISGETVLVEVTVMSGKEAEALNLLTNVYGMTGILPNGGNTLLITGFIPIANLNLLNNHPDIFNFVEPVYPSVLNAGVVTTLGDAAQGSFDGRQGYGLSGAGIKVGSFLIAIINGQMTKLTYRTFRTATFPSETQTET
ncbi:MAG: hypothetical protein R2788_11615 [Saprospiraceae bacterium]